MKKAITVLFCTTLIAGPTMASEVNKLCDNLGAFAGSTLEAKNRGIPESVYTDNVRNKTSDSPSLQIKLLTMVRATYDSDLSDVSSFTPELYSKWYADGCKEKARQGISPLDLGGQAKYAPQEETKNPTSTWYGESNEERKLPDENRINYQQIKFCNALGLFFETTVDGKRRGIPANVHNDIVRAKITDPSDQAIFLRVVYTVYDYINGDMPSLTPHEIGKIYIDQCTSRIQEGTTPLDLKEQKYDPIAMGILPHFSKNSNGTLDDISSHVGEYYQGKNPYINGPEDLPKSSPNAKKEKDYRVSP